MKTFRRTFRIYLLVIALIDFLPKMLVRFHFGNYSIMLEKLQQYKILLN
jgi:hypothetical protein